MGVPTSEVGYTSVITERGDHKVHKGHVVDIGGKKYRAKRVQELLAELPDVD
jgi:hypothetical protein